MPKKETNKQPETNESNAENEIADTGAGGGGENELTSGLVVLRSITDIIKDLSKPVAARHLKERQQGGKTIHYISWYDAVRYMDLYAPGWCYEVVRIESIAGKLILTVRVTVPCAEGIVFRDATGQEVEETNSYGDSSSNAESMALRRAFAKFGLGLYLYDGAGAGAGGGGNIHRSNPPNRTGNSGNAQNRQQGQGNGQNAPSSGAGGDMISDAQLSYLTKLCVNNQKDENTIALNFSNGRVNDIGKLTKKEAIEAINELQGKK